MKKIFLGAFIFISIFSAFLYSSNQVSLMGGSGYFYLPSASFLTGEVSSVGYSYYPLSSDEMEVNFNNFHYTHNFTPRLQSVLTGVWMNFTSLKNNLGYDHLPQGMDIFNSFAEVRYLLNKNLQDSPVHVNYGIGFRVPLGGNTDDLTVDLKNVLNVLYYGLGEDSFSSVTPFFYYGSSKKNSSTGIYLKLKGGLGIGAGYREKVYKKLEIALEAYSTLYKVGDVKLDKRSYSFGFIYPLLKDLHTKLGIHYLKISFEGTDFSQFESSFFYGSIGIDYLF
jgi:hypothetical protein